MNEITLFATAMLPNALDLLAPDGSEVRLLLSTGGGGMAHFLLPSGHVSRAVRHRSVEEIWFVLSGQGEMWRADHSREEITSLRAGTCLTIPIATAFQFRALGPDPLAVIGVTMPPWPGSDEAEFVAGAWAPYIGEP